MNISALDYLRNLVAEQKYQAAKYGASGHMHASETHQGYAVALGTAADHLALFYDPEAGVLDNLVEPIAKHNYSEVTGSTDGYGDVNVPYENEAEKLVFFLIDQGWTPPLR